MARNRRGGWSKTRAAQALYDDMLRLLALTR
jgi:hypothetical protein